ncbi:MAG: carboxylating nicotinate-nucleotide diphosphorylase [Arthrobacter sp.]|jgi:nicotinate-nucleotide pyrophosphorylase (carboxylating)|nr:carboxylating nicotinate-nucleotide diphosphorylase [Arthrobacter sp.]
MSAPAATAATATTATTATTGTTATTVAGPAAPAGASAPAGSLPAAAVDAVLRAALQEDAPYGDITSQMLIPTEARASAVLAARVPGVFSGGDVFAAAMRLTDPDAAVDLLVPDGASFTAGTPLARVRGNARAVLLAERVALNLVQRMSAIATKTAEFVALVDGTGARITDTRKTTPGLRVLERYAVRCGGGANHRFGLSDAVLAKDNHLAVLTGGDAARLTPVLRAAKARLGHTTHFEVEVDRMEQIEPVLAAGVDTIMLDNFTLAELAAGVAQVAGRARVEASGNVNLGTVAGIAATGVDVISIGALTHSVAALDLGLDLELEAAPSAGTLSTGQPAG